jgi:CheY-like chemotaxis protein
VESSPGMRCTFRVELPAETAKESEAGDVFAEIESIVVAPDQPQFRILVIEDDEVNRLLLRRLLEGAGFQSRTAADGETGIGVPSEWHPNFIWLDIRLPGINGLEVATEIRQSAGGRDVKIAALTASVFDDQRNAFLTSGVDDIVRKPILRGTVFEGVERLLGVRYLRSTPAAKLVTDSGPHDLAGDKGHPEDLKSQLLNAVRLLDKERIIEAIRLVWAVDPALGNELTRRADVLEFTSIMPAIQSGEMN